MALRSAGEEFIIRRLGERWNEGVNCCVSACMKNCDMEWLHSTLKEIEQHRTFAVLATEDGATRRQKSAYTVEYKEWIATVWINRPDVQQRLKCVVSRGTRRRRLRRPPSVSSYCVFTLACATSPSFEQSLLRSLPRTSSIIVLGH